jgi:hydroxymethylbilane synthase
VEFLNDPAARAATTCERALLNRLGGGCQVPIGAFAEVHQTHVGADAPVRPAASAARIHLDSLVADPDGSKLLRDSRDGDDPEELGNAAGTALLARGGNEILAAVYSRGLAVPPQP